MMIGAVIVSAYVAAFIGLLLLTTGALAVLGWAVYRRDGGKMGFLEWLKRL